MSIGRETNLDSLLMLLFASIVKDQNFKSKYKSKKFFKIGTAAKL
jgi:hypothetical protein